MSAKTGGDSDPSHEEDSGSVIEVGSQAVWSLSSCKPGKLRVLEFIPCDAATNFSIYCAHCKQALALSSYETIVWTLIGNPMAIYHI